MQRKLLIHLAIVALLASMLPLLVGGTARAASTGTVKDVNGQAVASAFVMLFDMSANPVGYAITDAAGGFALLSPADNSPLTDQQVDDTDGFVVVQPNANIDGDGLGIYPDQPRSYLKPPNTPNDMVLPKTSSFVLKGYLQDGTPMRWQDFVSSGPGTEGAQFVYLTNMDEEMRPAMVWPTYDAWAREAPQNADRKYGLPSLVVDSRNNSEKYSIGVLYWNVKDYGKLSLKADNAGQGFDLPAQGGSLVVDLNTELARTAISDLVRRQAFYQSNITDEDIPALIAAVGAVPNVDDRLSDALKLRDRLELKAARDSLSSVRKGTLDVVARDVNMGPVKNCAVTIDQTSHDFLFGGNGGAPFQQQQGVWQKVKDAGFEIAPILPAWGFTENPDSPYQYWGKDAINQTFGISNLKAMGLKVKMTGSVWMQGNAVGSMHILPVRTQGWSWDQVRTGNIVNQGHLLDDFKDDAVIWEAMNEPATTNTVACRVTRWRSASTPPRSRSRPRTRTSKRW
jgi:hypothetical protein